MKAYIMNDDRELLVTEVPGPVRTDDNIICKVKTASICGTDLRTYLGGNMKITPPRVQGHEFAGDIVYVGKNAAEYGWKVGDRVSVAPAIGCGNCPPCKKGHTNMCDHLLTIGFQFEGTFAEYLEIPAQAIRMGNLIKLPDEVSYDDATLLEPCGCVINAQEYMRIEPGDDVVIYGSGFIGCVHAELALKKGAANVIVCEPSARRGQILLEKVPGAIWIDNSKVNAVEEIMRITNGKGADVVICATSVGAVHAEAQDVAAKMARISLFGGLTGSPTGWIDSNKIHYKELQICGVHATTASYMKQVMAMIQDGSLDISKYVEKHISLDEIEDVLKAIRDENIMKVIVHP